MSSSRIKDHQSGQIIIIALVFMTIVAVAVGSLVGYAGVQIKSHRQAVSRSTALSIAEAGLEAAVWKLNNQPGYNGETGTVYGAGTYNITLTNLSGSSKLVKADATTPNGKRTVQVTATLGATNIAFNYGVHVDAGGLEMDNNSTVVGNVYSNGPVRGESGASVTGTATSAGASGLLDELSISSNASAHTIDDSTIGGSANAYTLSDSTVGGNVSANSISHCTIGGNAAYNTKSACTIGGTQTTPNPSVPPDLQAVPLPITDSLISDWKSEAEAGGVISSQTITGSVSLGPKKISGNLTVTSGGILTLTGTLWVTGNISVDNSGIIRLNPSFGSLSGVIVTDGWIHFDNNGSFSGSGTPGSYLMFLTTLACTGSAGSNCTHHNAAVDLHNNVGAAIIYAKSGLVNLHNNVAVKELTAYKIHLSNNATVTYDSGLANALFSSGPAGGWEVQDGTWQLLQ